MLKHLLILACPLLSLVSCGGKQTGGRPHGEPIALEHSRLLKLEKFDGWISANVVNPWDTSKSLNRYALVPKGTVADGIPGNATVIHIPVERAVVFSSVHNSLLYEMGAADAIAGLCDSRYILEPSLKDRVERGEVADCGENTSPSIEKVIQSRPEAILLSPYENAGHGGLEKTGVPILECADYMEADPLGRLEWVRFYGMLFGVEEKADSIYRNSADAYLKLKRIAGAAERRPLVMTDRIYGSVWDVPSRRSTMGTLIHDAGGTTPFEGIDAPGSIAMDAEKVLWMSRNADIWLIRYSEKQLDMRMLGKENPVYPEFDAYKKGRVYGSNTMESRIFEDQAFHPQWILADMIRIFHPELQLTHNSKEYYHRLK